MTTDPEGTLSPERAEAVWRRAAQLQAEAAQRLEERSRLLAGASADPHPHEFTLDEVQAAAREAGISPEFVALAAAELGTDPGTRLSSRQERAATRRLGTAQRTLVVARTVDQPPARVYEAMQRVLPAHPWYLTLSDSRGDPLAGGVLVFDIPGYVEAHQTPLAGHAFSMSVKQLQVMLRPSGAAGCAVVVSAALGRSVRRNYHAAGIFAGTMGAMGAGGGAAVAAAVGAAGALLALPAAAGAALLGGVAALGYRALYRHSLRGLQETLERMLHAAELHARTGGGFTPAPLPPPPAGQDDGGAAATAALVASTIV